MSKVEDWQIPQVLKSRSAVQRQRDWLLLNWADRQLASQAASLLAEVDALLAELYLEFERDVEATKAVQP